MHNETLVRRGRIDWLRSVPFFLAHLAPLGLLATGFGLPELCLVLGLYFGRMFFVTAGYHRYFSHRSFKAGRIMQFVLAFGAETSAQKGVLWWSSWHRHHHRHSDGPQDVHSPKEGFWHSHVGWILSKDYFDYDRDSVRDWTAYPEIVWLDRLHLLPPVLLGAACFLLGGWSFLFAFFLSTVLLWHGTFFINSLAHVFGHRRYATTDTSRNSLILALLTMGEGWHNNHHHEPGSARQGFFWYEIDGSYMVLRLLSWLGLVRELRVPCEARVQHLRIRHGHADIGMLHAHLEKAGLALSRVRGSAGNLATLTREEVEAFVQAAKDKAAELVLRAATP